MLLNKSSLVFLLISTTLFSQKEIKTYNGVFETGKASYSYYENDTKDRIYQGSFLYTGNPYKVQGEFDDNKRTKTWTISALNKSVKSATNKGLITCKIQGNYENSQLNGKWTASWSIKAYNKKTRKYASKADVLNAEVNFKNNHFIGNFKLNHVNQKKIYAGNFDENGFPDGLWTITSKTNVEEMFFNHGFLLKHIQRNLSTGDKKTLVDDENLYQNFLSNYNTTLKSAKIDNQLYILDTTIFEADFLAYWNSELIPNKDLGSYLNPLAFYQRAASLPKAYIKKLIPCDATSNCLQDYEKKKQEDLAQKIKLEQEAAEQLRLEELAKEEKERIEKEKEQKRIFEESIKNGNEIASQLMESKNYIDAINQYTSLYEITKDEQYKLKINEASLALVEIKSKHENLEKEANELMNQSTTFFSNAYDLQPKVKAKKKTYGVNYLACIDLLKSNLTKQLDQIKNNLVSEKNQNVWNEVNDAELKHIRDTKEALFKAEKFYLAVDEALKANNKTKLRILNSSLNYQNIINDMIK